MKEALNKWEVIIIDSSKEGKQNKKFNNFLIANKSEERNKKEKNNFEVNCKLLKNYTEIKYNL